MCLIFGDVATRNYELCDSHLYAFLVDSMILNGISHIKVRDTQKGKLCLLNVDIQMVGAGFIELLVGPMHKWIGKSSLQ